MNIPEIITQFNAAMLENGIEPPPNLKTDGILHRFYIKGHKSGSLNGAYKLHIDGIRPAGFFQNYADGLKVNWKYGGEIKAFTPEEKAKYAQEQRQKKQQAEREQAIKHANAANEAARIWAQAKPATEHPYLTKKRIQPHGSRILNNSLVLPVYDAALRIMSLQFIAEDGQKRFLSGGMKKGCYWWVGQKSEKILIAEGFATAATLHEATGHCCFIAWDAGNLKNVAEVIRAKRPDAHIIICADNDHTGRGQEAANDAALAVDGYVSLPPDVGTDWNDFYNTMERV